MASYGTEIAAIDSPTSCVKVSFTLLTPVNCWDGYLSTIFAILDQARDSSCTTKYVALTPQPHRRDYSASEGNYDLVKTHTHPTLPRLVHLN